MEGVHSVTKGGGGVNQQFLRYVLIESSLYVFRVLFDDGSDDYIQPEDINDLDVKLL